MYRKILQSICAALLFLTASSAVAEDALLTLTSADGDTTAFTRADLEAMPVTEFSTSTIWTEGVSDFTGVSLADFVAALSLEGGAFEAIAINDYAVEIPMSDAVEGGAIIAYKVDGEEMSPRDKGPLWVIYPFDQNGDYRTETYYSRSIWQLDRINVQN